MTEKKKDLVRLELLIGKLVRDKDGKRVGKIEAVHAHRTQRDCVIDEFIVGREGLAERLGSSIITRAFGFRPSRNPGTIPWRELDLSDPEHPRLRCRIDELEE